MRKFDLRLQEQIQNGQVEIADDEMEEVVRYFDIQWWKGMRKFKSRLQEQIQNGQVKIPDDETEEVVCYFGMDGGKERGSLSRVFRNKFKTVKWKFLMMRPKMLSFGQRLERLPRILSVELSADIRIYNLECQPRRQYKRAENCF
jgi:hypothetical protein